MDKKRCVECDKRRVVYPATRTGGGNYRTPPRQYRSSICLDCARSAYANHTPGHLAGAMKWDPNDLKRIVADSDRAERNPR